MRTFALVFALLVATSFAADASITAFTGRNALSAWTGAWTVKAADVALCKAVNANCCFDAGSITPTVGTSSVTFEAAATSAGTNQCGTVAPWITKLSISLTGTAASEFTPTASAVSAATIAFKTSYGTAAATVAMVALGANSPGAILAVDGSANATPTYAIRLPVTAADYTASSALNLLYVPTVSSTSTPTSTTSAALLASTFVAILAFFL